MLTITRIALALLSLTVAAIAQTASPNLNDQQVLAADPTFQNRIRESLISTCASISSEAVTGLSGSMPVALHLKRANYCSLILAAPDSFKQIFADAVATNTTVINDATQTGTVPLTSTNAAAQATKVLDADVANALSSVFNGFLSVP
jgi:hypothetical protein